MKLTGRRESTNVDDRRGMTAAKAGGVGIVGIIIALLMTFLSKGSLNLTDIISLAPSMMGEVTEQAEGGREFTEEEQALATFSKQILAGTEDVWTEEFKKIGRKYEAPKMVLYTGAVQTGCGNGSASMGPFYCSADQCLYIDLSFFTSMKQQLGADGDFAYAYVIAHEVGHHVEYLLGTLGKAHQQMAALSKTEANRVSVQIELQADFLAGVWGHDEQRLFGSLEKGDLEEALNTAIVIGDDHLQKRAGYNPDERQFTHGTSAQRSKWLKKGIATGDPSQGDTFSIAYNSL